MNAHPSNKRGSLALGPTEHQTSAKRPAVHAAARTRALAALKSTYGFDAFRGKQEEAVLAALAGRDVLVIMPTGGGKTICYVIPALVQPGVCIVVSPLLALMQDQVVNLTKVGVRAAQLSSALPAAQRSAILADLAAGGDGSGQPSIRLLLVTPELLAASDRFRGVLHRLHAQRNLSLFAVDESHCISTWGHDFRPAYRKLQALRRDFPGVPIMALTATAAAQVQDDICKQLSLQNPVRLLSSFNRRNISYTVRYLDVEELDEMEALVQLLTAKKTAAGILPCSIVYCQKRATCEAVARRLEREGLPAAAYHGQMGDGDKKEVLRRWQADEVPVVAATIAFGMGIDKAGVRLVVHFNLPRSLEGYYQEAGRAGRDGDPAESVVFYSWEARTRMDYVLRRDQDKRARKKGQKAGADDGGDDGDDDDGPGGGGGRGGAGGGAYGAPVVDGEDVTAAAAAAMVATADEKGQVKTTAWKSFGQVVDWAVGAACRRRALLAHFGEDMRLPGGRCAGTGDEHGAGCDYCRNPQHVAEQLEKLRHKETKLATQRQRLGGGGGGKGDDEEADMFAVRGGAPGGDADGGGRDGDEEEGPSIYQAGRRSPQQSGAEMAEARSAAAAARAAAGGQVNDKYFSALAALERDHERRARESAGDVVDRMLAGGGGGGASGNSPPAPPADAATRATATSKLAAALSAGQAGTGLDPTLVQRLAAVVEAEVYGTGLPRQQYINRMAGLLSRAKTAVSVLALLPQSAAGQQPQPTGAPAQPPTLVAELLPSLLQAEVAAIESLLLDSGGQVATAGAAAAPAPRGGGGGCAAAKAGLSGSSRAVARLGALASVAVTVGAVAAGGVGKRVNKLGRNANPEVAEAARQVVESWKRQLPEKKATPPPPQQAAEHQQR